MALQILFLACIAATGIVQGQRLAANISGNGVDTSKFQKTVLSVRRPVSVIRRKLILQKLDHFNEHDFRVFQQHYLENPNHYVPGGPIFLHLRGTLALSVATISDAVNFQWIVYARRFNAYCFSLEHRYFGNSTATANTSTENLKWLTVEQSLEDICFFIESMNAFHQFRGARWILFGCSYAGTLAAWSRLRYPRLVTGAVASSAAMLALLNFKDYAEITVKVLNSHDPTCLENIFRATRMIEERIQMGIDLCKIKVMFRAYNYQECDLSNAKHVSTFLNQIFIKIAAVVLYNGVNTPPYNENLTITAICDIINDQRYVDVMNSYAAAIQYILEKIKTTSNFCSYEDYVRSLKNYQSPKITNRLIAYLIMCSEFGLMITSDSAAGLDAFSKRFPVEYFLGLCEDVFGATFIREKIEFGITQTNRRFGGLLFRATNVVFLNGDNDPNHPVGIYNWPPPGVTALLIKGAAHCADYFPPREDDSSYLQSARQVAENEIRKWLQ